MTAFEALMTGVKAELIEDGFSAAVGKFREAVNLSRGLSDLQEAAVRLGIETATEVLPRGARIAEAILLEAAEVDSKKLIPRDLWTRIQERERDETIRSVLLAADGATTKAMLPPVRQRLALLAERYPGEARLQERLKALDAMAAQQTGSVKLAEKERQARAAKANQLRELDPAFPGLQEEVRRERLPLVNWNHVRNAAMVGFTAVSLTTAAGLIWMNRSKFTVPRVAVATPAVSAPFVQPVSVRTASADEMAWSAVNPHDMDLVESYLERFPNGANRGLAVQALSDIRIQRRQSAEVLDLLRQYEAAWNARNIDGILSLERDLDRSALQARLWPVKSMVMSLSSASSPHIEGDQATVRCLRTVSEVDEAGVVKRSPEEAVTFLLARRHGSWIIQSASQQ